MVAETKNAINWSVCIAPSEPDCVTLPELVQKQKTQAKETTTRVPAAWSRGQRHTRMGGAGALRGAQRAHKSRESEYSEVSLRVLHFDSWRGARTLIADGLATSPTSASSGRSAPGLEGLEG